MLLPRLIWVPSSVGWRCEKHDPMQEKINSVLFQRNKQYLCISLYICVVFTFFGLLKHSTIGNAS